LIVSLEKADGRKSEGAPPERLVHWLLGRRASASAPALNDPHIDDIPPEAFPADHTECASPDIRVGWPKK